MPRRWTSGNGDQTDELVDDVLAQERESFTGSPKEFTVCRTPRKLESVQCVAADPEAKAQFDVEIVIFGDADAALDEGARHCSAATWDWLKLSCAWRSRTTWRTAPPCYRGYSVGGAAPTSRPRGSEIAYERLAVRH